MTTRGLLPILIFFISLFFSQDSYATKFVAVSSDKWSDPNTWDQNAVPTSADTVYIDGFEVTVDLAFQIKSIFISNENNSGYTSLKVKAFLEVTENLTVTAENKPQDVDVFVFSQGNLTVNGDVNFIRTADNDTSNRLQLNIYGPGKAYILGDFTYDYKNALVTTPIYLSETSPEIILSGNAIFDVTGQTTLIARGGKHLDFISEGNSQVVLRDSLSILVYNGAEQAAIITRANSQLQLLDNAYLLNTGGSYQAALKAVNGGQMAISGSVVMESTAPNKMVKLISEDTGSEISISGDITMKATAESSSEIFIGNSGTLKYGGDILRPTSFGALVMETDGMLILNGTEPQTIPDEKLLNSGSDSLLIGNISIENTSSSPITLTKDFVIKDTLVLSSGNIKTNSSALLVIEDGAGIKGGNDNAYIEGPVLKKGAEMNVPVKLPIGDANNYAPLTFTPESTLASAEYTAEYRSDPPPFGVIYNNASSDPPPFGLEYLNYISGSEYWQIDKSTGTPDAGVRLSWHDAEAQGINDLNDLVVAAYSASATDWISLGNGGTTGTIGSGGSGTINLASDPPPFGVIYYTLGSISALNSLPVELTSFQAVQQNMHTFLQWETASEKNTSHFSIERSTNGDDFKEIGTVQGNGDGIIAHQYTFKDITPVDGINYYRLKIIDHDNSFEYSNIEVIKFEAKPTIQLFPNPVKKTIQLEGFDSNVDDVLLEIYDRNGRMIFTNKVSINNGKLEISTEVVQVQNPGTYFLRVIGQSENHVLKFIKIN